MEKKAPQGFGSGPCVFSPEEDPSCGSNLGDSQASGSTETWKWGRVKTRAVWVCKREKSSFSLTLQDAPAMQEGPLVPGMREPTTQAGSLQSFRHVTLSPVPGRGKQRCPLLITSAMFVVTLTQESIKKCCFAASSENYSWDSLENSKTTSVPPERGNTLTLMERSSTCGFKTEKCFLFVKRCERVCPHAEHLERWNRWEEAVNITLNCHHSWAATLQWLHKQTQIYQHLKVNDNQFKGIR